MQSGFSRVFLVEGVGGAQKGDFNGAVLFLLDDRPTRCVGAGCVGEVVDTLDVCSCIYLVAVAGNHDQSGSVAALGAAHCDAIGRTCLEVAFPLVLGLDEREQELVFEVGCCTRDEFEAARGAFDLLVVVGAAVGRVDS